MRPVYHTGKNGVKAGEMLTRINQECRREAFEAEARRAKGSDDVAGIHE
jgi:hypothetical protein